MSYQKGFLSPVCDHKSNYLSTVAIDYAYGNDNLNEYVNYKLWKDLTGLCRILR